ncbi:MAG: helix-turn-helix transcriptional regulator [Solidesulfovibrio sp.]|uniref:helix-turn-helix domain-containing protein n=1 Tax=Solidesulfovibrio sp. TaxID=2910990 RepID=UPI002B2063FA|nr:helix-turn-helix transcriptional regulator [Solidesulfovibrio sp.]MEA4857088.1 helix-turn-helix transcriptional regulator [Solidesulfovibrio sp.]
MIKTRIKSESSHSEFSSRLKELIQKLGIEKKDFALAGEIAPQTLTGYLDGTSQPKQDVLAKWFQVFRVNLNWLVTGHGEMFFDSPASTQATIPEEEISKDLTPEQRTMLTYKRLQSELGTAKERIADGIDAIVMGKCVGEKQTGYNSSEKEGLRFEGINKIHEKHSEFGAKK